MPVGFLTIELNTEKVLFNNKELKEMLVEDYCKSNLQSSLQNLSIL